MCRKKIKKSENLFLQNQFDSISDITLLCKVVDNFGDIGVVYRLARSLLEHKPDLHLRLVCNNLDSFFTIAPGIDPKKPVQEFRGIFVLDWNNADVCLKEFTATPPSIILECFECGRPDWLEEILFEKDANEEHIYRRKPVVRIINIEYLSAESWVEDFHLLKSGTRSPYVKKTIFMPGFTRKTGGLILDNDFLSSIKLKEAKSTLCKLKDFPGIFDIVKDESTFSVLVFCYEHNCRAEVAALSKFSSFIALSSKSKKNLHIFAASECFIKAWEEEKRPFSLSVLPKLPQETWDALLCTCDFAFVRGEDSFSRVCLCSTPFLWQAYMQEGNFQLVKVKAFLDILSPFFSKDQSDLLNVCMILYNKWQKEPLCYEAKDALESFALNISEELNADNIFLYLKNIYLDKSFATSFENFSHSLLNNKNLTDELLMALGI